METQTMIKPKTNVEVKVLAINTLYEYAKLIIEHEKKHFNQFIGKDIFKVDGSLKAKYEHEKLTFKGQMNDGTWFNVHSWYQKYSSSFDLKIKVCVNGGSYDVKPTTAFCQYEEISTTLYELDNNCLIASNRDYSYLDKVYNVDELTAISLEIEKAAKEYEKVKDKMPYIFNDVFYIKRLTRS